MVTKLGIVLSQLKILTRILFIFTPHCLSANTTQQDFQTWLNATITGYVATNNPPANHLKYWVEGQERIGENSTHSSQTLARVGLGYALQPNLSLWFGYAWIRTGTPYTSYPFNENRIWQQLLWTSTVKNFRLMSRTRTEQRFLANNSSVAYRIRQLSKISIPWTASSRSTFVVADEIFWHKNDFIGNQGQGFDQNRLFIGLGYRVDNAITFEYGYMNQFIKRFNVPNVLNNNISVNMYVNF